jgi:hypothetical protein
MLVTSPFSNPNKLRLYDLHLKFPDTIITNHVYTHTCAVNILFALCDGCFLISSPYTKQHFKSTVY